MAGERLVDAQLDFSGGVQSDSTKTIQSPLVPNGIKRSQLSWLINGTVRGGGISQRTGFQPLVEEAPWSGIFQGAFMYQPDFNDPHILVAIGGKLWRIRVDTDNAISDLSTDFGGLTMPADQPQAYFTQAEMFAVWQSGDLLTNPIFYDFGVEGVRPATMRRSNGFVGVNDPTNEIPPAGPMDFSSQRCWYAIGRQYIAGDISGNQTSGTAPYDYRDSVIHVTENPLANGGDAFLVPTNAGNIRALKHTSNIDTALGQSQLFVFTRQAVYACTAPVTRTDWTATTNDLQPLQRVVLTQGGAYAERAIVAVNGDLFFCGPPNGDIWSLTVALRYFSQWGNIPLSRNENRVLQFNDRSLLRYASGIAFDNRLLQATLPVATPVGAGFKSIIPLDFDLISSLEERLPPAWEGTYEGLNVLQLLEGNFGGRQRAFAFVWSDLHGQIELWEITADQRFENGDQRVQWQIETPAYTWNNPTQLKELETLELWFDKILGTVEVSVDYRPDSWPCWIPWRTFKICVAKNCTEDLDAPCSDNGYPTQLFCEGDKTMVTLPRPVGQCVPTNNRPSNLFYQCQFRIKIHGWTRVRGILAYAFSKEKRPFENLVPNC